MNGNTLSWTDELAGLRRRAEALRAMGPMPDPIRRVEGEASYARLRAAARALFEAAVEAYRGLCPPGYPCIDDNGILVTGGAIGIRFSEHHSFWFAFEQVKRKKPRKETEEPLGLAGALGYDPNRRLPGSPPPRPKPSDPVRLAMIALRFDEFSGWSEIHRPLDPRWDETLLREHLAAYLATFGYDVTVAARVKPEVDAGAWPEEGDDAPAEPAAARSRWRMHVPDEE
jgi:hypothetical protein